MRMEEIKDNIYVKETDSVERYLLDIVKRYFESTEIDNDDSREYIINKAVERMKEELFIDNAGVLSVNGRTGEVIITLEELQGEPLISSKLSAFNVDFGNTPNTACMGNDPRLSDKRKPVKHTHDISEINGLEGQISSISNSLNLLGRNVDKHDNIDVLNKITYTGQQEEIDLIILDTIQELLQTQTLKVNQSISDTENKINLLISQTTNELAQYIDDYENAKTYTNEQNNQTKEAANKYCDEQLQIKKDEINELLKNKVSKEDLESIIGLLNNQYHNIYEINIINFITNNESTINYLFELPNDIATLVKENKSKIDLTIKYTDPISNKNITMNLPFIYAENGELLYTITGSLEEIENGFAVAINSTKTEKAVWSSFINSAVIKAKISIVNKLEA